MGVNRLDRESPDFVLLRGAAVAGLVDGVTAIVLTLLVLDLHLPDTLGSGDLQHYLWMQRWTFVAYVFGVCYLGCTWLGTRFTLRGYTYIDEWSALYYVAHLGAIAVLPFAVDAV